MHFALMLAAFLLQAQTRAPQANFDESKVGAYTLPDPLVLQNGQPVRTADQWNAERRPEILDLFAENVYGHSPKPRADTKFNIWEQGAAALDGLAIRKQITIYFSTDKNGPKEELLMYLPAKRAKPVPVILTLNFGGNQSVVDDPGIKPGRIFAPKTHLPETAPESSRGHDREFEVRKILDHGYGFATVNYQDIEPDFNGGIGYGIRPLFFRPGQSAPANDDWGSIGAWAYGLSRAMDVLEQDKQIDAGRIAIMGHSRLGKTVLWAGALDQRFALIIASCPGEGGASLARRNYGEDIHHLVTAFPYWFCKNFAQYAEDPKRLPVDMHELIALLAPRPVYITAAEQDKWSDPKGEFLAAVAAGPVYRLLGVQGLGTDQMPPLNTPILHTIAFHYRTGKHEVTAYDWDQFLKFADAHLKSQ